MELKEITHKMLSRQLKELEADEMIIRKEYTQVPPKVEYFLTEKGKSLMPLVDEICKWGEANRPNAEAFEAQHKWHLGEYIAKDAVKGKDTRNEETAINNR